jgi:tripartite-type tricarboxylate transporter receptor subunit TctC
MKGWKIVWLMSGIILFTFYGLCLAQEKYPSRPIELVVPFAPGGSADVAARAYADDLSKALKVSIYVVNRAGGTGIQGVTYVVRGKKDGYTLLGTTGTPLIIMPNISKEVTYDPLKDLIPIGRLGSAPSVFAVRPDSPFKTLKELIEYARQNPGKLKNGAGGVGTESNFNLAVLCSKEKINITSVPFQSGGEAGDRIQKAASGSSGRPDNGRNRSSRRQFRGVVRSLCSHRGSSADCGCPDSHGAEGFREPSSYPAVRKIGH